LPKSQALTRARGSPLAAKLFAYALGGLKPSSPQIKHDQEFTFKTAPVVGTKVQIES
jgi:hypothetical protein